MRYTFPLPAALRAQTVTTQALRELDISRFRAHRRDMTAVSRGIYLWTPDQDQAGELQRLRALSNSLPQCCVSDSTAAKVHGVTLPWEIADDDAVHLTQPAGTSSRIRRPGITSHRRAIDAHDLVLRHGLVLTTPARTWFDLAEVCSLQSLVQLGDHLVRQPRFRFEGRHVPHASLQELQAVVDRAGRVKGKRKAKEAVTLIRVGADSFRETEARLRIIQAGLPEPQLQVRPFPGCPYPADMGYTEWKIAIQYDGGHHFTPEQARRDQQRDNAFFSAGWVLLRWNAEHARDGFATGIRQLGSLLQQRRS
ncbi:hypothetical protein [Nesterenkonia flava]|uniref:DUF559 domain-containing protein n=1 Tax=Nesterenkonia flava TaxID=469799 RepID=A0ABU1FQ12_9MICC|nr:hypothetical protein [Nesterenkonia flava]MDR5710743.1 hypothetical protein [Nesterenkonia flava]